MDVEGDSSLRFLSLVVSTSVVVVVVVVVVVAVEAEAAGATGMEEELEDDEEVSRDELDGWLVVLRCFNTCSTA